MVIINGEEINAAGRTVSEQLSVQGLDFNRVAVMYNDVILEKSSYAATVMQDGDTVEIVGFVGGG